MTPQGSCGTQVGPASSFYMGAGQPAIHNLPTTWGYFLCLENKESLFITSMFLMNINGLPNNIIDFIVFEITTMLLYYFFSTVLIQTGLCFGYLGNDAIRAQTGKILTVNKASPIQYRLTVRLQVPCFRDFELPTILNLTQQ